MQRLMAEEERGKKLLWSFPILVVFIAAALLPAAVTATLIIDGVESGRTSWVLFGCIGGALWLFGLYLALRKKKPAATPATNDSSQ